MGFFVTAQASLAKVIFLAGLWIKPDFSLESNVRVGHTCPPEGHRDDMAGGARETFARVSSNAFLYKNFVPS